MDNMESGRVWHLCDTEMPRAGSRVVVLYEDGSGAYLGYWTGAELIDADGDEAIWSAHDGRMWAYLPRGFDLWCEVRGEDAFTFPRDASLAEDAERLSPEGVAARAEGITQDQSHTPSTRAGE